MRKAEGEGPFYWGTKGKPGHYLFDTALRSQNWPWSGGPAPTPWGGELDGHLNPSEIEGDAALHHKDGWTALAFANRTDDSRPGSNAVFLFHAVLDFDGAVAAAREHFPQIVGRFRFDITAEALAEAPPAPQDKPSNPKEAAS